MIATGWPSERGRRVKSLTIFGMLLGGAAGLVLGGPVYGVIGAIAGHLVDRYRDSTRRTKRRRRDKAREAQAQKAATRPLFDDPTETRRIAFATAIIVLSAKLAKADGVVSRDEINAFKRRFMIEDKDVGGVARIYDEAKRSADGYQPYARQIKALFGNDPILLEELLIGLFEVAKADGELKAGEIEFLREVAKIFGFGRRQIRADPRHLQSDLRDQPRPAKGPR